MEVSRFPLPPTEGDESELEGGGGGVGCRGAAEEEQKDVVGCSRQIDDGSSCIFCLLRDERWQQ